MGYQDTHTAPTAAADDQEWASFSLPYFKTESSLPAALPTRGDILASNNILSNRSTQKTVIVGDHFVVKYGPGAKALEGQNLLFVEKFLRLPAPVLFAMYHDEPLGLVIIMERIHGTSLEKLWPSLLKEEKIQIMTKLRCCRSAMRALPSPSHRYYGSIEKGPLPHDLFFTFDYDKSRSGPFSSEQELYTALISQLTAIDQVNERPSHKAKYLAKQCAAMPTCGEPVFTHSDIQKQNIMVTQNSDFHEPGTRNFGIVIIDWEFAGWYPNYWEHFATSTALRWDDDWAEYIDLAIDVWPTHVALVNMISQNILL